MFKAIIDVAISVFIVLGSIAVAWFLYRYLHAAFTNPSIPHGVMWHTLFDR